MEVKRDLREGQRLSGILFQLAKALAHEPGRKAVLLLEKPTLTRRRLESAWESAQQLFRPELARRLRIWIKWEKEYDGPGLIGAISASSTKSLMRRR